MNPIEEFNCPLCKSLIKINNYDIDCFKCNNDPLSNNFFSFNKGGGFTYVTMISDFLLRISCSSYDDEVSVYLSRAKENDPKIDIYLDECLKGNGIKLNLNENNFDEQIQNILVKCIKYIKLNKFK